MGKFFLARLGLESLPAGPLYRPIDDGASSVFVNLYDLPDCEQFNLLLAAPGDSSWKFGGVFHAGLEVYGTEFYFALPQGEAVPHGTPGLCSCQPRRCGLIFRHALFMRRTTVTLDEVKEFLQSIDKQYTADKFHFLKRNSCHFVDDFYKCLQVGPLPAWVNRLAGMRANMSDIMNAVWANPCC